MFRGVREICSSVVSVLGTSAFKWPGRGEARGVNSPDEETPVELEIFTTTPVEVRIRVPFYL